MNTKTMATNDAMLEATKVNPAIKHDEKVQLRAVMEMKPPSKDLPVSTLDKGASNQGSQDCWGQTLETKLADTVWLASQNIDGLLHTTEIGETKLMLLKQ